jgi:SAM-dependent methyltransferase
VQWSADGLTLQGCHVISHVRCLMLLKGGRVNLKGLYGAVPLAHFFLRERVRAGDLVVDATCGNGQDTLLLAQLAGESGRVLAFDVQQTAIEKTRERLKDAGLEKRVELVLSGHERISGFLSEPAKAFVFNLGYLPSGDRRIKTISGSTLRALEQTRILLQQSGLILISVYTGHDGGEEEWAAVKGWCKELPPHEFNVWQSRQLNRGATAPFLVVVEKMPF